MPHFRMTYVGYMEGEYDDAEAAKAAFLEALDPDYTDYYGRSRADLVEVEEFDEESGTWK